MQLSPQPPAESANTPPPAPKARILWAEVWCQIPYVCLLEQEGYEVITADDGEDGFAKALALKPDCIFADVMIGNLNGFEFLKRIRASEECATTPFLFFTAMSDKSHIREGFALGANAYMIKPCVWLNMLSTIDRCLKGETVLPDNFSENTHY